MSSDAFQSVAGIIGIALLGIAFITISNSEHDGLLFWVGLTLGLVLLVPTLLDRLGSIIAALANRVGL